MSSWARKVTFGGSWVVSKKAGVLPSFATSSSGANSRTCTEAITAGMHCHLDSDRIAILRPMIDLALVEIAMGFRTCRDTAAKAAH